MTEISIFILRRTGWRIARHCEFHGQGSLIIFFNCLYKDCVSCFVSSFVVNHSEDVSASRRNEITIVDHVRLC